MRTANHGVLQTKASGDCLVRLTLKGVVTTVKLRDCLHAPSACINLLSVGRMTATGSKVACSMDDGKFVIASGKSLFALEQPRYTWCFPGNQSNLGSSQSIPGGF
jgi:hypothetical protein